MNDKKKRKADVDPVSLDIFFNSAKAYIEAFIPEQAELAPDSRQNLLRDAWQRFISWAKGRESYNPPEVISSRADLLDDPEFVAKLKEKLASEGYTIEEGFSRPEEFTEELIDRPAPGGELVSIGDNLTEYESEANQTENLYPIQEEGLEEEQQPLTPEQIQEMYELGDKYSIFENLDVGETKEVDLKTLSDVIHDVPMKNDTFGYEGKKFNVEDVDYQDKKGTVQRIAEKNIIASDEDAINLLHSENEDDRIAAVLWLGRNAEKLRDELFNDVYPLLTDSSPEVRFEAIRVVGQKGDPKKLISVLQTDDYEYNKKRAAYWLKKRSSEIKDLTTQEKNILCVNNII